MVDLSIQGYSAVKKINFGDVQSSPIQGDLNKPQTVTPQDQYLSSNSTAEQPENKSKNAKKGLIIAGSVVALGALGFIFRKKLFGKAAEEVSKKGDDVVKETKKSERVFRDAFSFEKVFDDSGDMKKIAKRKDGTVAAETTYKKVEKDGKTNYVRDLKNVYSKDGTFIEKKLKYDEGGTISLEEVFDSQNRRLSEASYKKLGPGEKGSIKKLTEFDAETGNQVRYTNSTNGVFNYIQEYDPKVKDRDILNVFYNKGVKTFMAEVDEADPNLETWTQFNSDGSVANTYKMEKVSHN